MSNPYTGFLLDQEQNVECANSMDPEEESTMLLLPPTLAGEMLEALGNFATALDGLIDLRPEVEPVKEEKTPPASSEEETPGERLK